MEMFGTIAYQTISLCTIMHREDLQTILPKRNKKLPSASISSDMSDFNGFLYFQVSGSAPVL